MQAPSKLPLMSLGSRLTISESNRLRSLFQNMIFRWISTSMTQMPWRRYPADWMMLREGEDYPRLAWQEIYPGDIAGLYGVDMVDAAYLSSYWQVDCPTDPNDCGRADIIETGSVDIADLTALLNNWLLN